MDIEQDFIIQNLNLEGNKDKAECHTNAKIIYEALKEKGYKVILVKGSYLNLPKAVKHSWIEWEDKILETDCRQLREEGDLMPNDFCAVLDKTKFAHRYKHG